MAMARRETAPRVAILCTLDCFYANPIMYGTKNHHGMSRDERFRGSSVEALTGEGIVAGGRVIHGRIPDPSLVPRTGMIKEHQQCDQK